MSTKPYSVFSVLRKNFKYFPTQVEMEEDNTERQELDEIARSEGGLVAVTKVHI